MGFQGHFCMFHSSPFPLILTLSFHPHTHTAFSSHGLCSGERLAARNGEHLGPLSGDLGTGLDEGHNRPALTFFELLYEDDAFDSIVDGAWVRRRRTEEGGMDELRPPRRGWRLSEEGNMRWTDIIMYGYSADGIARLTRGRRSGFRPTAGRRGAPSP